MRGFLRPLIDYHKHAACWTSRTVFRPVVRSDGASDERPALAKGRVLGSVFPVMCIFPRGLVQPREKVVGVGLEV